MYNGGQDVSLLHSLANYNSVEQQHVERNHQLRMENIRRNHQNQYKDISDGLASQLLLEKDKLNHNKMVLDNHEQKILKEKTDITVSRDKVKVRIRAIQEELDKIETTKQNVSAKISEHHKAVTNLESNVQLLEEKQAEARLEYEQAHRRLQSAKELLMIHQQKLARDKALLQSVNLINTKLKAKLGELEMDISRANSALRNLEEQLASVRAEIKINESALLKAVKDGELAFKEKNQLEDEFHAFQEKVLRRDQPTEALIPERNALIEKEEMINDKLNRSERERQNQLDKLQNLYQSGKLIHNNISNVNDGLNELESSKGEVLSEIANQERMRNHLIGVVRESQRLHDEANQTKDEHEYNLINQAEQMDYNKLKAAETIAKIGEYYQNIDHLNQKHQILEARGFQHNELSNQMDSILKKIESKLEDKESEISTVNTHKTIHQRDIDNYNQKVSQYQTVAGDLANSAVTLVTWSKTTYTSLRCI